MTQIFFCFTLRKDAKSYVNNPLLKSSRFNSGLLSYDHFLGSQGVATYYWFVLGFFPKIFPTDNVVSN